MNVICVADDLERELYKKNIGETLPEFPPEI